jgi:hypothetical protein
MSVPTANDGWGEFAQGLVPHGKTGRTRLRLFLPILLIPYWGNQSVDPEEKQGPAEDIKYRKTDSQKECLTSTRRIEKTLDTETVAEGIYDAPIKSLDQEFPM